MRFMLKVSVPTQAGNEAIKSGSFGDVMAQFMERHQPEACYFGVEQGQRTMYAFLDIADLSQMPVIGEPFFMGFQAEIELSPVMNAQDLRQGLSQAFGTP